MAPYYTMVLEELKVKYPEVEHMNGTGADVVSLNLTVGMAKARVQIVSGSSQACYNSGDDG